MRICEHCGMYMKPFPDGTCEFCGKRWDEPIKPAEEMETSFRVCQS